MRQLCALVYETSAEPVETLRSAIVSTCWGDDQRDAQGYVIHRFSFEAGGQAGLFSDVGGEKLWRTLNEKLKTTRLG
jgi:hypothetical protein